MSKRVKVRALIVAAAVAAVAALGLVLAKLSDWTFPATSSHAGPAPAASAAQPAENAVAALGRIEPQSEIINLGAGVAPDRLESLFVGRGDRVEKDQVLGYLGGYAEQLAQREMFRAQLDEAKRRLKTESELDQTRIEAAEIHRKQVLEVSPLRIAAQEAAISSLEALLANDKDILESNTQLFDQGYASRRLREDLRSKVLQDDANLAAARARLSELKRQFEVDQKDAEVQLQVARAALERAQAEFPVASLERQMALADARARRATLYAPVSGRILNIRVKPGEEISTGPILSMGDTSKMRAVAEVYETDIARVRLGQGATIRSPALPKPIGGKVVRIGNMIFKNDVLNVDPAARADARVVEVWIELDDAAPAEGLTNLTVDVLIDTSGAAPADAIARAPAGQP